MDLAPVDYASGLGALPNPVEALQQAVAFKIGLAQQKAQTQLLQTQAAEAAQKLTRQQLFQQAVADSDGSPASVSTLMRQYPEVADQLKSSFEVGDKAKRDADVTALGEIYSAGTSGNWDLASKAAHARLEADKAAGQADPADQAFVDAIDSGDPAKRKQILTVLGTHLAAATGPDHFASTFNVLNPTEDQKGQVVGRAVGHYETDAAGNRKFVVDYRDPAPAQYKTVTTTDADGNPVTQIVRVDGDGQPQSTPTGPADAPGGFDHAVATVLSNEGGYNPSDMNGAPVKFGINQKSNPGVDVKNLTRDQAVQIYHDKYWVPSGAENLPANLQTPYFDVYVRNPAVAKRALAASGGDPAKFADITDAYFQRLATTPRGQKYAEAWSARDANNRAIATGGAPAPAVAPPAGGDVVYSVTGKNSAEGGFDPQAVEFSAQQYLATGQMPTLGMGKAAAQARKQIIERAAQIAGADGLSGTDFAVQIAHYKAATQALKTLETQAGTVQQNEQTALANGQQFIDRSRELAGQTRYPALNSVTQTYLRATGDPTIAAMDSAWQTFTTEYAKVVAGSPTGSGTLSDSARREAQDTMRGNYSYEQKLAAFKQMQNDMANRMAAIHNTIAGKYDQLTKNPRSAAQIAAQTDLHNVTAPRGRNGFVKVTSVQQYNSLPKGTRYIDPNGVQRVKQ